VRLWTGRLMEIQLRRATPEDAAALAAVEVRSWRAAYRGLMPDAFLDGLSEAEKTAAWRQNLLKHGPSGRKRVCLALSNAGISGFVRVGPVMDEAEVGLIYERNCSIAWSALIASFLREALLTVLLYCTIAVDRNHAGHGREEVV
jgi:hypothetical protein